MCGLDSRLTDESFYTGTGHVLTSINSHRAPPRAVHADWRPTHACHTHATHVAARRVELESSTQSHTRTWHKIIIIPRPTHNHHRPPKHSSRSVIVRPCCRRIMRARGARPCLTSGQIKSASILHHRTSDLAAFSACAACRFMRLYSSMRSSCAREGPTAVSVWRGGF